ncbi:MAG: hypothetical protein AAF745_10270, partial [Planctomycetota bacterium]
GVLDIQHLSKSFGQRRALTDLSLRLVPGEVYGLNRLDSFRSLYQEGCSRLRVDYVPLNTSEPFDTALTEYLLQRQAKF